MIEKLSEYKVLGPTTYYVKGDLSGSMIFMKDSTGSKKTLKAEKLSQNQQWRESTRITIAATLVGFAVATFFLLPDDLITIGVALALKIGIGLSGFFAFLYILSTGSHLKYREPGYINAAFVTDGMRRFFFDMSIESFAAYFLFAFIGAIEVLIVKFRPSLEQQAGWIALIIGGFFFFAFIVVNYKLRDTEKSGRKRY
jgi:hypothetical protein